MIGMNFAIELELEADGHWSAEVPDLPGVLAYGAAERAAIAAVEALALRVLADRVELGEAEVPHRFPPLPSRSSSRSACWSPGPTEAPERPRPIRGAFSEGLRRASLRVRSPSSRSTVKPTRFAGLSRTFDGGAKCERRSPAT